MGLFDILAVLLSLAAVFSYINHRFIRLPTTIGVMLIALVASLLVLLLGQFGFHLEDDARRLLGAIDFNRAVLDGVLSFLLFAGALHVNLNDLREQGRVIGALATFGVLLSTALVGVFSWAIFGAFGLAVTLPFCFLFGALISPTDPIAVLGIVRKAGATKSLETKITGESLFNDGVGVVIFLVLLSVATGGGDVAGGEIAFLFAKEVFGGAIWGFLLGWLAYSMLKSVDNYQVEVLITLALVTGGYAGASALHLSGPIAMVVGGLMIGNHGRRFAMSETTREHLDTFWELMDEVLNVVLFVLLGLEVLAFTFSGSFLLAGLVMIPAVLLARFIAVLFPVMLLRPFQRFSPYAIRILTWGGLRGGISVALALALPPSEAREPILAVTYLIVVFSILVQGTTVGRLVALSQRGQEAEEVG
ncbi:MAG: sodium:proton antiporter [Deltaproteobacteria bacterium]|nr:sodium:proton antiporter [Deltaproteobacteria bacterium]